MSDQYSFTAHPTKWRMLLWRLGFLMFEPKPVHYTIMHSRWVGDFRRIDEIRVTTTEVQ